MKGTMEPCGLILSDGFIGTTQFQSAALTQVSGNIMDMASIIPSNLFHSGWTQTHEKEAHFLLREGRFIVAHPFIVQCEFHSWLLHFCLSWTTLPFSFPEWVWFQWGRKWFPYLFLCTLPIFIIIFFGNFSNAYGFMPFYSLCNSHKNIYISCLPILGWMRLLQKNVFLFAQKISFNALKMTLL